METKRWQNPAYKGKRKGKDRREQGIEELVGRQAASEKFPGAMVAKDAYYLFVLKLQILFK